MKKFIIAAILILSSSAAQAMDCAAFFPNIGFKIKDEVLKSTVEATTHNLDKSTPINPEAPPIIPDTESRKVIDKAGLSAYTQMCKLSEKKPYPAIVNEYKASGKYSDRQLHFIDLLYGYSAGIFKSILAKSGCNPRVLKITNDYIKQCTK